MTMRVPVALLFVVSLVACGNSDNSMLAAGSSTTRASGLQWPVNSHDVAVIGGKSSIGVTDGTNVLRVVDLGALGERHTAGDDRGVALQVGEELVYLDLLTGNVSRRRCEKCSGIAIIGDKIVSVKTDFTMLVLDRKLGIEVEVPIDHVTETPANEFPTEPSTPTVIGAMNGLVAMAYRATNGIVRGGPSIVSLYLLDGQLTRSWPVGGLVYSSAPTADGRKLVLGVGGSSGACDTLSVPVILDPDAAEAKVLVPKGYGERADGEFDSLDLWWNGTEIVALGWFAGMAAAGCKVENVVRRFGPTGQEMVSIPHSGLLMLRMLGTGCSRALEVESGDAGQRVVALDHGKERPLEGYNTVLWSSPRGEACQTLPGLGG